MKVLLAALGALATGAVLLLAHDYKETSRFLRTSDAAVPATEAELFEVRSHADKITHPTQAKKSTKKTATKKTEKKPVKKTEEEKPEEKKPEEKKAEKKTPEKKTEKKPEHKKEASHKKAQHKSSKSHSSGNNNEEESFSFVMY